MKVFNSWIYDISLIVTVVGIALEMVASRAMGLRVYESRELLMNLLANLASQVGRRLQDVFFLIPYAVALERLAIFKIEMSVANLILAFFCFEFLYYWVHRMRHRVAIFWAEHSMHHQPEYFNISVGIRLSFFHRLSVFWITLPLAILGFDVKIMASLVVFEMVYQVLIHTCLIKSFGPLDWFLNSPAHHRVHHGQNPQYVDKNYGGTLIIWDRLFGTYAQEVEPVVFGVHPQPRSGNLVALNIFSLKMLVAAFRAAHGWKEKIWVLLGPPREVSAEPSVVKLPAPALTWQKTVTIFAIYVVCLYLTTRLLQDFRSLGWMIGSILAVCLLGLMTLLGSRFENARAMTTELQAADVVKTRKAKWG